MRRLFDWFRDQTGMTLRSWQHLPNAVYVFNFHRVGNDNRDAFHPNLFSCTGNRFAEIVAFLKQEFVIIGEERLIKLVDSQRALTRKFALITFDDGYADNYEIAFPILRSQRCEAIFFVASDFVESDLFPWWDRIAWRVYHRGDGALTVPGTKHPIQVRRRDLAGSIRRVLRAVKDDPHHTMQEKVDEIERQVRCDDLMHTNPRLFMSWDNLRELVDHGMSIGSHTRGHQILSHLKESEQRFELTESKRVIESQLGISVKSIAYPVGHTQSYSDLTLNLAAQAGYQLGFNFLHHVNRIPLENRFEISRIGVDENASTRDLQRRVADQLGNKPTNKSM